MRRPLHTIITPRVTMFVFTGAGSIAVGSLLPGVWAATFAFSGTLLACAYASTRPPVPTAALPWMSSDDDGLTLNAVLLRSGQWWPNLTYKPHIITPSEAVSVLRQAADQITDDWSLPR